MVYMIKAVIFDFGGVIRFNVTHPILEEVALAFDISFERCKEVYLRLFRSLETGEIDLEQFWALFSGIVGKPLPEGYLDFFVKGYEKHFKLNKEVVDIIKKLKCKKAMLSNSFPFHKKYYETVAEYFELVVLSHEVGIRKPSPEIYQMVLDKLGVKAKEAFFVDDIKSYVEAAKCLGIHALQFKDANQLKKELKRLGL